MKNNNNFQVETEKIFWANFFINFLSFIRARWKLKRKSLPALRNCIHKISQVEKDCVILSLSSKLKSSKGLSNVPERIRYLTFSTCFLHFCLRLILSFHRFQLLFLLKRKKLACQRLQRPTASS